MASRKLKKDVKAGVDQLQNMFETMMEKHSEPKAQNRTPVAMVMATIPHLLLLALTVLIVWTAKPSSSLFSWHPTLMSLACLLLMSEAILVFSPWSSPIISGTRPSKVQWHWVLHAGAAVSIYTGLAIITANKYINGSNHYTTWHGTFGIIFCGVIAMQITGGIIEQDPELLPFKIRQVVLKRMHAISGLVTYFGGLATILLSLYSRWFVANVPNPIIWGASLGCIIIQATYVLVQISRNHILPMIRRKW